MLQFSDRDYNVTDAENQLWQFPRSLALLRGWRLVLLFLLPQSVLVQLRFSCDGFRDGDRDPLHVVVDVQGFGGGVIEINGDNLTQKRARQENEPSKRMFCL